MSAECQSVCPSCGRRLSGTLSFCPACLLRDMLAGEEAGSGEPPSEDMLEAPSDRRALRFEHYELLTAENGKPIELGRGAMGITYKAFDIDLQCPVTLKVISEKYLGDEGARLRFLREARAAASVRHPNVASVFHLGRTGRDYFYAMEFVEGETLESLIKRFGRLDMKLALKITSQVASGLAGIDKQKLIHRDIKPSNIMVSLQGGGVITTKIIDLGLAKPTSGTTGEVAISTLGGFAGTPEFASPEQFAGVGVDIRSDLYSLGATLWEMLTGQVPFRGSPDKVMYQHQHGRLPLEQLRDVPQPVVVLLEALLEKDPARRIQGPAELLEAVSTITSAIEAGRTITSQNLQELPLADSQAVTHKWPARFAPERISIARLPVTASSVFGREEDVGFLDAAWANEHAKVVTIVAWAGVGKSTLVNHWLRRMAVEHYRSAELVFGWSFYRQGSSGGSSSADEFLDFALSWFGDPDPRTGTPWEKGERLAKLISHRRTLLVLDGLEPLQNPPGPQEGRMREPSLQALLRELAALNMGLCVITTRLPVADLADHEGTSTLRRELEQLSSDAGAKLLRALGVKGPEAELRSASDEFRGHCLALTLLGSYLTDAYNGDIHRREEVSERLAHDVRQGVYARKVMESYQTWFGEGPEVSVLRLLGLFDRPADEKAVGALLKPPAIRGLTESLTDLSPNEWRTILAKLRRARLVAGQDPYNPRDLDTHPLVREYYGGQLRSQQTDAWKECNRRLFNYYQALAPQLPDNFREMEPLFSAVICGCNAGLYREALHKVYIPRIQQGDALFAAHVVGARGALLLALAHFFENGQWGSPVETAVEEQSLTAEDQLFVLMQAGQYLTATRGFAAREALICYERAEPLCQSLNRPLVLSVALTGQWRYSLNTDKLTATMQIAERMYSLAQDQSDSVLMIGACCALALTHYFSGNFGSFGQYATHAIRIWRSGDVQFLREELDVLGITCLCYQALHHWNLGEIAACQATIAEAISMAKELNDMHGLAVALYWAARLSVNERHPSAVERLTSELIELSTRQNFPHWLALGTALRGWAHSASGDTEEGLAWIEGGIEDWVGTGAVLQVPYYLGLKSEALYLANRTSEALAAINEAEALVERFEDRHWCAEQHRLRGVFLTALGADETQIEASFCAAIRTAKEQNSVSLAKRAQGTYAEYRRQKLSALEGHALRLPLC
jgi:serine/threonine protein kinase